MQTTKPLTRKKMSKHLRLRNKIMKLFLKRRLSLIRNLMIHRESILLRGNQLHALLLGRFQFLRFSYGHLIGFPFGFFGSFCGSSCETFGVCFCLFFL